MVVNLNISEQVRVARLVRTVREKYRENVAIIYNTEDESKLQRRSTRPKKLENVNSVS